MKQSIFPARRLFHAGDVVSFRLEGLDGFEGEPLLRCTIGNASAHRQEVIDFTEKNLPPAGTDWHDLPMKRNGDCAELTLPLAEIGIFEAKCCFLQKHANRVLWPEGGNFLLKVESADSVCANSVYSAFIRQFGENRFAEKSPVPPTELPALDNTGYTVIPPSGTFRKLKGELDHIFLRLGCRILQLLPVHPAPTVYGRMGRYGSPFASLDYFNVDPALADFDPKATPLEQFEELIDAVHSRDGRIFMDIPVNHTGWASRLQTEHPEYFVRRADGTFESPGAWGVVWEDLCKLDYRSSDVHHLMAEVFLHWCSHGVDGFRCDAGYMLPKAAWDYIVSKVRAEYPDTVFLLEGLGGKLSVQEKLLGESGLDWGYSELFQNYTRDEISRYFGYAEHCSRDFGTLINFSETHDNLRLAAQSKNFSRVRFAVAALLSSNGAFGFANGAEFYATERIDVHGCGALRWGAEPNLVRYISRLNSILANHPAFAPAAEIRLTQTGPGNVIAAERTAVGGEKLLALINLDTQSASTVQWDCPAFESGEFVDLIEGKSYPVRPLGGGHAELSLGAGQTLLLASTNVDYPTVGEGVPERVLAQRADAMALRAFVFYHTSGTDELPCSPGRKLRENPDAFLAGISQRNPPPVTHWFSASDERRVVMVPPGDLLLVECENKFRVRLRREHITLSAAAGIPRKDGSGYFAILIPPKGDGEREIFLEIAAFNSRGEVRKSRGTLLLLAAGSARKLSAQVDGKTAERQERYVFSANEKGGISMFPAAFGRITGKYDAVLAANDSALCPVDRRTMFTRLRGWIECKGYSQEISSEFLRDFSSGVRNAAHWNFSIPVGHGRRLDLSVDFEGALDGDAIRFHFRRKPTLSAPGMLPDYEAVRLILRPDLEDRINHQLTKAFTGPELEFPRSVSAKPDGFRFTPFGHSLEVTFSGGAFVPEKEWYYMVDLPHERHYGLEDKTDLFSPGYLHATLCGGDSVELFAAAGAQPGVTRDAYVFPHSSEPAEPTVSVEELLKSAMRQFVVRRDRFRTVIAGYPWFLDWGRDTLIALRGMIAHGFEHESRMVLEQFALFESDGTIPNMIRGTDNSNRDTSDAPLYLIVSVRDFLRKYPDSNLLSSVCGNRTMLEILESIADHYITGTPNRIRMDTASGLIFSPSHFTWMDTNFPAGTPREGYPIEIQSLWYAALDFLGKGKERYAMLAKQVQKSVEKYFFSHPSGRVSDCLHCHGGMCPAENAVPDDHTRSNMLTAILFGAVGDTEKQRRILAQSEELLSPGGIRSLADRDTAYELPVWRDGHLLNNPKHPYIGRYQGPEDTSRKAAYHNGTVWCWPFPAYCEALYLLGGEAAKARAFALLMSAARYFESGVFGQLPEVADGDAPHRFGGCAAQAWSVTEFARVYEILK